MYRPGKTLGAVDSLSRLYEDDPDLSNSEPRARESNIISPVTIIAQVSGISSQDKQTSTTSGNLSSQPPTDVSPTRSAILDRPDILPDNLEQLKTWQINYPFASGIIKYLSSHELPESQDLARHVTLNSQFYILEDNGLLYHYQVPRRKKIRDPLGVYHQLYAPLQLRSNMIN